MMSASNLIRAIGEIDDKYIVEFSEVKQIKTRRLPFKKLLAIAACLVILFASASIITIIVEKIPSNVTDITETMQYCSFDGNRYLIITDDFNKKLYELPAKVSEDLTGDYLGIGHLEADDTEVKIYDYLNCKDNSILVIKDNDNWYYIVQHNDFE